MEFLRPLESRGIFIDKYFAETREDTEIFSYCDGYHGLGVGRKVLYEAKCPGEPQVRELETSINSHLFHYPSHVFNITILACILVN